MSDEKGNTPQDRRAVALSDPDERSHFINQYMKDNPGITRDAVDQALTKAAAKIAPSEDRDALVRAVGEVIGSSGPP